MRKIPTVFVRDPQNRRFVTAEVTEGCEWVLAGEGIPTQKYDGTCVMFDGVNWWGRREVKPEKEAPPNFLLVEHDAVTLKSFGWEPIEQTSFYKFFEEAIEPYREFGDLIGESMPSGTYELIGSRINGNPERISGHRLERHSQADVIDFTAYGHISFETLHRVFTKWLAQDGIEGIVWHHPDGRMAKLKVRDFPKETQ